MAGKGRSKHDLVRELQFPPGYHFTPTDEELVDTYLRSKFQGTKPPLNVVNEVRILNWEPSKLVEKYLKFGENRWYFYTVREQLSEKSGRPRRQVAEAAGGGSWKATGKAQSVHRTDKDGKPLEMIGEKRLLVYYVGSQKMEWTMHEYVLKEKSQMGDWVLCTIQKKIHDDGNGQYGGHGEADVNGKKRKKKEKGKKEKDEEKKSSDKAQEEQKYTTSSDDGPAAMHGTASFSSYPQFQGYHNGNFHPAIFAPGFPTAMQECIPLPNISYPLMNTGIAQAQPRDSMMTMRYDAAQLNSAELISPVSMQLYDPDQFYIEDAYPLAFSGPSDDQFYFDNAGFNGQMVPRNSMFSDQEMPSMHQQISSTQEVMDGIASIHGDSMIVSTGGSTSDPAVFNDASASHDLAGAQANENHQCREQPSAPPVM